MYQVDLMDVENPINALRTVGTYEDVWAAMFSAMEACDADIRFVPVEDCGPVRFVGIAPEADTTGLSHVWIHELD